MYRLLIKPMFDFIRDPVSHNFSLRSVVAQIFMTYAL